MALEGKLSDFNFAEILQLVETQQKSGYLTITGRAQLLFVFENGVLISTRDRRRETPDPLERYLRRYGFFADHWKHIEFIKQNSSLDLTEILISEQLVDEAELDRLLEAVAQEITHTAMKLDQGEFIFTAVREPAAGLHGTFRVSVQGMLMEAARRIDEESRIREYFPSLQIAFQQGAETPGDEEMSPTKQRLFKMALAGEQLGKIVNRAQVDSFVTRSTLFELCQDGLLSPAGEDSATKIIGETAGKRRGPRFLPFLRTPLLTAAALLAIGAVGFLRWQPLWQPEAEGASALFPDTRAGTMAVDQEQNRQLRLRQIRHDVESALEVFHFRRDDYPLDLSLLVKEALLPVATYRTVVELGWTYTADQEGDRYRLHS